MGSTMGKNSGNFLDLQGTLHVVMLGLDSAGKSTALYRLKFDQYLNTVPTIGFNCEKIKVKAKNVQFLVWDVGGQEKLRPLWRSYTRCTDGILFVVDSVDIERMEEAKMELMRTAKCPDNQGVPVLILANKQDLPGARDPKELEKLLGLHELLNTSFNITAMGISSASTGNIAVSSSDSYERSNTTPTTNHNKSLSSSAKNTSLPRSTTIHSKTKELENYEQQQQQQQHQKLTQSKSQNQALSATELEPPTTPATVTTPTTVYADTNEMFTFKKTSTNSYKGWHIQPACAITGEGLQEGLEALYDMIIKRRKLNKMHKRKR